MPKTGNKNTDSNTVPTLAAYIAAQIANKRAAALDKSRNRTSIRVPMLVNETSKQEWETNLLNRYKTLTDIKYNHDRKGITVNPSLKEELKRLEKEYAKGYSPLIPGPNCIYNAGDCYGLNIAGNVEFASKSRQLGFKKGEKGSMEPGDIVQDVRSGRPVHAMIYDSKDKEGNLLFNYSRGYDDDDAFDINKNYVKQGKYPLPIKDYDVYKFVGTQADSTQWANDYKRLYGNQMKCGGRRKAQLGLDIREGGIAIPIAPNMYYMNGRSHDEGGIGIGPNNKNGLEVEGGEVVKVGDKDIKVFSSVPLLRGVSPAQLVMGGANPNKVFKAQEEFKDRNHINDDGTRYQTGGQKIYTPNKSIQHQIQETGKITIGGAPTIGGIRTFSYLRGLANTKKYGNIATNIFRAGKELIKRSTQKLVNSGKITKEVAQAPRSIYGQFIGGYGQNLPKTFNLLIDNNQEMKAGGIYIKPSKRGTFTAAAKKRGMGVQEFASKVLANKEDYSPAMVKKANFARNASRWKKELGGSMIYTVNGNVKNGLMSARPKAVLGKQKTIIRAGKEWEYDEKSGAYVPVKDITKYKTVAGKTYKKEPNSKKFIEVTDSAEIANLNKDKKEVIQDNKVLVSKKPSVSENKYVATTKPNTGESYSINPLTGEWIRDGVIETSEPSVKGITKVSSRASSTPRRGGGTKSSSSKAATKSTPTLQDTVNQITRDAIYRSNTPKIDLSKAKMPTFDVSQLGSKERRTYKANIPKSGRWVGQYKSTNAGDWIGLGSNLAGTVASYFMTKNAINKMPDPIKPVMAQAAKLKTRYNVEPQLTGIREAEQMNRAAVRRNTQSSNVSLAREQRLMNEARGARNQLYGQKENIETQLINQDRLNRQSVIRDAVRDYNEYLNRLTATRQGQNQLRISNINNLLSGLTGSVNNILGTIESRRATNNTLRAIAAANPNVDARLIGGFDYYIDPITKRKYNKNQQYIGTING